MLEWKKPNPGLGLARKLPVLSAFQGLEPEGPFRKMIGGPHLHSGDTVLSSSALQFIPGLCADEWTSGHWGNISMWQEPMRMKENTMEGWAR